MCVIGTTCGYNNLSKDFNVFLVGDATLATYPASITPKFATQVALANASLRQMITQVNWVKIRAELEAFERRIRALENAEDAEIVQKTKDLEELEEMSADFIREKESSEKLERELEELKMEMLLETVKPLLQREETK
jgi:hypothetical protein